MDRPLWQRPVSYAAIGATQARDLLRYPPTGYRASEHRRRIGHGDARFEFAWSSTLSWGIQRAVGFRVEPEETPAEVVEQSYLPVSFGDDGTPIAPAVTPERRFGPDGTPFVVPGDTAWIIIPVPFVRGGIRAPARVIYVIDEPDRKGFAYGTLPGHPEDGEELFLVSRRDDGSVWMTIRQFSRPASRRWWAVYPALRLAQEIMTQRYLGALAKPLR